MKDDSDKQTKDMLHGIEHGINDLEISHGYFDKRYCKMCQEYRHFYTIGREHGKLLVRCSHCPNALFIDD